MDLLTLWVPLGHRFRDGSESGHGRLKIAVIFNVSQCGQQTVRATVGRVSYGCAFIYAACSRPMVHTICNNVARGLCFVVPAHPPGAQCLGSTATVRWKLKQKHSHITVVARAS